jgi:Holliday junction resolvase RusA-like endonuclease
VSKDANVAAYQRGVALIVQNARPRDWKPPEQIRLRYWMRLHGRIDADNALKALNDAIAHGLGVNDACFLPCIIEKSTGNRNPYV